MIQMRIISQRKLWVFFHTNTNKHKLNSRRRKGRSKFRRGTGKIEGEFEQNELDRRAIRKMDGNST